MIIITGGAGYIGSRVFSRLSHVRNVFVLDSLVRSGKHSIPEDRLIKRDIGDAGDLGDVSLVIHCAAFASVGESMVAPGLYHENNVEAARRFFGKIKMSARVVYLSSSSVYGSKVGPISEGDPTSPVSPYGESKLELEEILRDRGDRLTVLRLFNVAGGRGQLQSRVVHAAIRAAMEKKPFVVKGDGMHVRDIVDVEEVADVCVTAVGKPGIFNVGSGVGSSVMDVIRATEEVTGKKIKISSEDQCEGDPRHSVADVSKLEQAFGFRPRRSLLEIVRSAAREWGDS